MHAVGGSRRGRPLVKADPAAKRKTQAHAPQMPCNPARAADAAGQHHARITARGQRDQEREAVDRDAHRTFERHAALEGRRGGPRASCVLSIANGVLAARATSSAPFSMPPMVRAGRRTVIQAVTRI